MKLTGYAEYYEYTTRQNDMFDRIALDFYGDERMASVIMQANPDYAGYVRLPEGVLLEIPVVEQPVKSTLPPWKVSAL